MAESNVSRGRSRSTALLVFPADRGHFMPCIPIAAQLGQMGFDVELWCHTKCLEWIGDVEYLFSSMNTTAMGEGDLLGKLTSVYKQVASLGESDEEGQKAVWSNQRAQLNAGIAKHKGLTEFVEEFLQPGGQGMDELEQRLMDKTNSPVTVCIYEVNWLRSKVAPLCDMAGVPQLGIVPTFAYMFRAHAKLKCWGHDGQWRVRDTQFDVDFGDSEHAPNFVWILSECLRQSIATSPLVNGEPRLVVGPLVPFFVHNHEQNDSRRSDSEKKHSLLQTWLSSSSSSLASTAVTLVSLGSQSQLKMLSPWAEVELIRGCLDVSPRVLFQGTDQLLEHADIARAVQEGRLRFESPIPQWEILCLECVQCFVSHCGANSSHEAILAGVAVCPLPFFDDQYYIAQQFENVLYNYPARAQKTSWTYEPLRKRHLRKDRELARKRVGRAVALGLGVEDHVVEKIRSKALEEKGVEAIGNRVLEIIDSFAKHCDQ